VAWPASGAVFRTPASSPDKTPIRHFTPGIDEEIETASPRAEAHQQKTGRKVRFLSCFSLGTKCQPRNLPEIKSLPWSAFHQLLPRSDPVRQVLILLDLFVHRMAIQVRIVFLLLDALRDGLLVPKRKITRDGLPLFAGFCALQGDEFLHDGKWIEGSDKSAGPAGRNLKSAPPVFPQSFSFS
jgi:hypothetical protein